MKPLEKDTIALLSSLTSGKEGKHKCIYFENGYNVRVSKVYYKGKTITKSYNKMTLYEPSGKKKDTKTTKNSKKMIEFILTWKRLYSDTTAKTS